MSSTPPTLLGLPAWPHGRAALLAHLQATPGLHALHSLNAEIAVQALDHAGLAAALRANPTNLIDGAGVAAMLALKHGRRFAKISGSDVVYDLADLARAQRWPVLLLGGSTAAGAAAQRRLQARTGTEVVWLDLPRVAGDTFAAATLAGIRDVVARLRPGLVVVCLGAPKQELWIEAERAFLQAHGVRVCLSAGGTLEFVAGTVRRAPRWVSAIGLEWLFRLLRQPRQRLPRLLRRLPRFLGRAACEVLRHRLGRPAAPPAAPGVPAPLLVLRLERHARDGDTLYGETSFVHWLAAARQRLPQLLLVARSVPRHRLLTDGEAAEGVPLGPGLRFLPVGPARGILGVLLGAGRIAVALLRARARARDVLVRVPEHGSFLTAPLLWLLRFRVHVWVVAHRPGMLAAALATAPAWRRPLLRVAYALNARAERRLLRRARSVFTNGPAAMAQFAGVPAPDPVVVVSSTIARAHIAWAATRRQALLAAGGPPATALRGLCVARLSPEKGHDFLFTAMAGPAAADLSVRLVGFEDPGHGDRLRRLAAELGVAARLQFVGGLPAGRPLLEEYAASDVVLLTSRMEGTPRVLAEAYMLGLPIVATAVGGIVAGYGGLAAEGVHLIPFGDVAAFAQALAEVRAWVAAGRPPLPRRHDRSVDACVGAMLTAMQAATGGGR